MVTNCARECVCAGCGSYVPMGLLFSLVIVLQLLVAAFTFPHAATALAAYVLVLYACIAQREHAQMRSYTHRQ